LAWLESNFSALLLQPKCAGHLPTNKQINGAWRVEAMPAQADEPILRTHRFLIDAPTGEAAIEEARCKIDQLLSD
jgi:hypothetical protein